MLQGLITSLNNQQQQQQGVGVMDESFSNLTSASGEASASNSSTNPSAGEAAFTNAYPLQQPQYFNQQNPNPPHQQPTLGKRKRSLPGNPDPDSEVIALSPKTLMAKNRFMCEICNKGFQRDQNLQLHRRGHNLPWKLKQRSKLEVVRKKVYVCPEASCVHHDPSRALGDLTGIKKHFCRKHGEKKWKCEKCNKRYAVQSDLKAHSKTCGTREYRCDCGTLFSRRDSFITHRTFCDALTVETARSIATNPLLLPPTQQTHQLQTTNHQSSSGTRVFSNEMINLHNPQLMNNHDLQSPFSIKQEQHHENQQPQSFNLIPPWLQAQPSSSSAMIFTEAFSQTPHGHTNLENPSNGVSGPTSCFPPPHPQMSATALLQRAAQIGATLSRTTAQQPGPVHMPPMTAGFAPNFPNSRDHQQDIGTDFFNNHGGGSFLHDIMMNPFANSGGQAGNEGLTRDFLGLAPLSHSEILSIAALGNPSLTNVAPDNNNPTASSSSPASHHEDHQRQNQSWQG